MERSRGRVLEQEVEENRWREECFLFLATNRKCGSGFRDDKTAFPREDRSWPIISFLFDPGPERTCLLCCTTGQEHLETTGHI